VTPNLSAEYNSSLGNPQEILFPNPLAYSLLGEPECRREQDLKGGKKFERFRAFTDAEILFLLMSPLIDFTYPSWAR
jgi:hypothetical protein